MQDLDGGRVSRRQAIKAGAVAAISALARVSGPTAEAQGGNTMARDAVQMYWFSQLAAREGKTADEIFPEALASIAEAGFSGIETNLNQCASDEACGKLAGQLGEAGLGLAGLYAGGALHDENAANTVAQILGWAQRAKDIGCPGVTCNPQPIGREKTDAELATQASALDEVGAGLADTGMFFGVHTHAPEMSHNAREFRANLDDTDPQKVGLCADVHWIYRGGADPYALTEQYADRVVSTHLRNSVEAVWAECFCAGDLDYRRIRAILDGVGYQGPLIVEIAWEERTPKTRSTLENLTLSREYLREVFAV
jgi:sugar phosphate isomerase/epimerase